VTHEYVILIGGLVNGTGHDGEAPTAIAWALDTVLAVGDDAAVLAISRGDSRVADLRGGLVVALDGGQLEAGGEASFSVLDPASRAVRAEIRDGQIVAGTLPGLTAPLDACADA
jgi:hypothetical protein